MKYKKEVELKIIIKNPINYSFLHFGKDGWLKATDEYETLVDKPEIVEEIFKKIGLIPKVKIIKTRKYFDCGDFEVTLDKVKDLGNFMEIEAKKDFEYHQNQKSLLRFLKQIKYQIRASSSKGLSSNALSEIKKTTKIMTI